MRCGSVETQSFRLLGVISYEMTCIMCSWETCTGAVDLTRAKTNRRRDGRPKVNISSIATMAAGDQGGCLTVEAELIGTWSATMDDAGMMLSTRCVTPL